MRASFGVFRLLPWTLLVLSSNAMPSKRAESGSVQYLITFGDSYSQTGFNITGTQPSPANPLGNPRLPGWTASGGLNWVGHLVSVLNTSTLLSYNFAYGGATTNATLVKPWRDDVLSLVDQVSLFTGSIGAAPPRDPAYAVGWTGANALFGVWMGVNDVGNSWWLSDQETHLGQIMDTYFSQMQRLYDAGARQFALLTVPPIHKTPSVLAQPEQNRAQEAAVIQQYNNMLASRAKAFGAANSGVTLKIVDTGAPFDEAIANPTKYGAPDATCFDGDGKSCLWFNDYHPGIAINKLVADAVVAAWKGVFFRSVCKG